MTLRRAAAATLCLLVGAACGREPATPVPAPAARNEAPAAALDAAPAVVRLLDSLTPEDVVPGVPSIESPLPLHREEEGEAAVPSPVRRLCLALPASECVQIVARVRTVDGAAARLRAQALRRMPAAGAAAPAERDRIEPLPGVVPAPRVEVESAEEARADWHELEALLLPMVGRRGVELVVESATGVAIARLEVRRVTPVERLLAVPRLPADRSIHEWRRVVRRGGDSADALLLHPGGSARWRLAVPFRARVEARLAAASPQEHGLRSEFRIDGTPLFPPPTAPPGEERFVPWSCDLAPWAGRTVELVWSLPADAPGTLLIGAPMLLAPPERPRPNLVVISIDTLRADQVGCYGGNARLTPAIDRLAAEGTRFTRFVSASSWTLPSHATLFSGQEPPVHGATRMNRRVEPQRTPLLATTLAEAGWLTAAFTGGGFLDPSFGLSAGFDRYSTRDPGRTPVGPRATTENPMEPVVRWVTAHRDVPFFLFVHTYVVHDYAPDDDVLAAVAPAGSTLRARDANAHVVRFGAGETELKPALETLYHAALHQADQRVVDRLLDTLSMLDLDERTLVALVSDHGDEWLEHDGIFHGKELWQELVHVPWIVRGPGVARGAAREDVIGHLDVAPTLLARLGVTAPAGMRGADALAPDYETQPVLSRVQGEDGSRVASVTTWPWRLLRRFESEDDPTAEYHLFRLDRDPFERDDLGEREPQQVAALERWLDAKLDECENAAATGGLSVAPQADIGAALRQQLEELGYTGE
ncbi:MAG: sulfatase [Planctomycetes bacterium]|nr:sulfatase [Planctomycetota bacterium]